MYLVIRDFRLKSKLLKIEISVPKLEVVKDRGQVQANTEDQWPDVHHKWREAFQQVQLRDELSKAPEAKEKSFGDWKLLDATNCDSTFVEDDLLENNEWKCW